MSTYEAILYSAADGVATLTLNRPAVHNAMNEAMRRDLLECFGRAMGDRLAKVTAILFQDHLDDFHRSEPFGW